MDNSTLKITGPNSELLLKFVIHTKYYREIIQIEWLTYFRLADHYSIFPCRILQTTLREIRNLWEKLNVCSVSQPNNQDIWWPRTWKQSHNNLYWKMHSLVQSLLIPPFNNFLWATYRRVNRGHRERMKAKSYLQNVKDRWRNKRTISSKWSLMMILRWEDLG
jgi:hypothetical protein